MSDFGVSSTQKQKKQKKSSVLTRLWELGFTEKAEIRVLETNCCDLRRREERARDFGRLTRGVSIFGECGVVTGRFGKNGVVSVFGQLRVVMGCWGLRFLRIFKLQLQEYFYPLEFIMPLINNNGEVLRR